MPNLKRCTCYDCQNYDPFNDEAPKWCGHPSAPLPKTGTDDARDCIGFEPEPFVLEMDQLLAEVNPDA